jgi:hypothetical protein
MRDMKKGLVVSNCKYKSRLKFVNVVIKLLVNGKVVYYLLIIISIKLAC